MFRHIALIISLTAVALAAGVAMVPGEREQWTMLVRDGRNQEAIKALEARYRAGKREVDAVLHLYKLYMSFAEIDQATRIMRDFVTDHPDDPAAVAMLAKHYGDIQNKPAEIRTLERLFELAPSLQTARDLLAHYRLEGAFDREESLLRTLLANQMITANDAERLGLMLAAHGDLYGARDALTRFDEIANPERSIGRLALFDVLVQIGDKTTALSKAASWIGHWRKVSIHRAAGSEIPSARLVRMMMAVDETRGAQAHLRDAAKRSAAPASDDASREVRARRHPRPRGRGATPAAIPSPMSSRATSSAAGGAGERRRREHRPAHEPRRRSAGRAGRRRCASPSSSRCCSPSPSLAKQILAAAGHRFLSQSAVAAGDRAQPAARPGCGPRRRRRRGRPAILGRPAAGADVARTCMAISAGSRPSRWAGPASRC